MIEYHGTDLFVLFRLGAAWEFTIPLASCWKGPLAVKLGQWNRCCGTVELTTFTMDYDAAHQRQISTGTHYGPTMDPLWTATDPLWTATDHCKSTAWKLFRHDIRPVASLHYSDPSDVKIKLRPDMRPDLQYDQPIFQWFFPCLFFLEWQCAFDIPIVSQDHLHTLHCNHYIMVFCVCICWCFLSTKVRMFFMPSVDGIHLKTSQNQTIKPSRSE